MVCPRTTSRTLEVLPCAGPTTTNSSSEGTSVSPPRSGLDPSNCSCLIVRESKVTSSRISIRERERERERGERTVQVQLVEFSTYLSQEIDHVLVFQHGSLRRPPPAQVESSQLAVSPERVQEPRRVARQPAELGQFEIDDERVRRDERLERTFVEP